MNCHRTRRILPGPAARYLRNDTHGNLHQRRAAHRLRPHERRGAAGRTRHRPAQGGGRAQPGDRAQIHL
ncbi:hypothetical protein MTBUT4_20113 [Magnetospirillum sp. UT-4]|nr:hypothetical protein MTBUT4_20113 [Magnetospirillum sp. UT-4]